jgi:hypothetical protein
MIVSATLIRKSLRLEIGGSLRQAFLLFLKFLLFRFHSPPSIRFCLNRLTNTQNILKSLQMRETPGTTKRAAWAILAVLTSCLAIVSLQSCLSSKGTSVSTNPKIVEWQLGALNASASKEESKSGNPSTISSPYGDAVAFDGKGDALFLERNPLLGLRQFTVEVIFRPDPKSQFEQRFLHIGEVNGDRMLIELRMTEDSQWYLDAFIKSGDSSKTLIDKSLLHPAGEWYHVALVVDDGKMDTFVAGKHELEGRVEFSPFKSGRTSIGARMNKVSWFKGAIAKIEITSKCLTPSEFIIPRR